MLKKICEVISIIKKKGYQAYLVGGSSRDLLLNRSFNDIDIASNIPLSLLSSLFEIENDDGRSMGSIKIAYQNCLMEITLFRKEEYSSKGIYPKVTEFVKEPEEDAKRRDFTINCIYLDPTTQQIIDPFYGLKDLLDFKIKFIGEPKERILEDPTRILRGIRLSKKLNFTIEEETDKAFIEHIDELKRIPNGKYKKEIAKFYVDLPSNVAASLLKSYHIDERKEN